MFLTALRYLCERQSGLHCNRGLSAECGDGRLTVLLGYLIQGLEAGFSLLEALVVTLVEGLHELLFAENLVLLCLAYEGVPQSSVNRDGLSIAAILPICGSDNDCGVQGILVADIRVFVETGDDLKVVFNPVWVISWVLLTSASQDVKRLDSKLMSRSKSCTVRHKYILVDADGIVLITVLIVEVDEQTAGLIEKFRVDFLGHQCGSEEATVRILDPLHLLELQVAFSKALHQLNRLL